MKLKVKNFFKRCITHISPVLTSKMLFKKSKDKKLDLKNPIWFNEKLMWLKLYKYKNNETIWKCCDKYYVREYALKHGVKKSNLPGLIDAYENASDIDFEKLPNRFALKCSHGCGFNIICLDKSKLDYDVARKKLDKWMHTRFGYETAELHYIHVKPHIICEKFIENEDGEYPNDYKLYCFNGKPKIVLVCVDRKIGYETAFYDLNWKRLHLREKETKKNIEKPKSLDKMIEISKKLSKEFPFVRMDFYEHNGNAILGEMTFTPAACLGKYTDEAECKLGGMLKLDK